YVSSAARSLILFLAHEYGFRASDLDVAEETDLASSLPVGCIVGIDSWSGTHGTEENVLRGVHYDPHMPPPNKQVSGLRICHTLKFINSLIEIRRTHVSIRKASPQIDCMYEMRAVTLDTNADMGIECRSNDGQAIVSGQCHR